MLWYYRRTCLTLRLCISIYIILFVGAEGANTTVLDYIHSVCPGASVVEHVGTDITFNIPKDLSRQMIPVYEIFRHLDQFSEQLGIASYGVSDTTLEEVLCSLLHCIFIIFLLTRNKIIHQDF